MDWPLNAFATAEDGTRLFWRASRSSPVVGIPDVVLCDGIGCDGFAWRYLTRALGRDRRVLHWHYRGHGRSGPPGDPDRLDVATLARDLVRVLDDAGAARVVAIGHSMGTQVVLEAYRIAPERVAGLGLLCGGAGRITETFHGTRLLHEWLPRLVDGATRHIGLARAIWRAVPAGLAFPVARLLRELDRQAIRFEDFRAYWDHVGLVDPAVFLKMLRAAGEHSAEDLLERIDVPTLVVSAEHDTFTPASVSAAMAARIPGAEHVLVRGASHAAPVEHPVPIQQALERLLDRVTEREATLKPAPADVAVETEPGSASRAARSAPGAG
ncbi:MAG: alpha/beta hydrolase [Myxococcota bacterium]|nr:alpha/beta hydrolase [Myxococcota bacterium]MDW8362450.1 alpha/beta hydrolase [Myxococcales bacterium]